MVVHWDIVWQRYVQEKIGACTLCFLYVNNPSHLGARLGNILKLQYAEEGKLPKTILEYSYNIFLT